MHRFILLLLSAVLVCCCGSSMATTWLSDDFDAYTTAGLAGQGGWTLSSGSSTSVAVETSYVCGGTGKSVMADYLVRGYGEVTKTVSSGSGGQYIDFDAAMDTAGPIKGESLGYIKIIGTNGLEITRFYFAHQQFRVLTAPATKTVVLDNVVARTWHHIRIGVNLNLALLDVWVDSVRVISEYPAYNASFGIGSIIIGQWDCQGLYTKSETYVDNLVCQTYPAPSATRVLSPLWCAGFEMSNVCYPHVILDSATGIYTMYYSGSASQEITESTFDVWATGYATSTDAANWFRPDQNYEPILYSTKLMEGDLLDPETMSARFDSIMAFGPCVIKDGTSYKMWYAGWNGDSIHDSAGITTKINFRVGYATSPDGLQWTKQPGTAGAGAVLGIGASGQADSKAASAPYVIKEGGTYRMWYEAFDGTTWRILYATSTDGMNWTKQGTALNTGPGGSKDALGVRNPVVITRNGQYELWYQGQSSSAPNYHSLRATSPDGLTWTRAADEVPLHPDSVLTGSERLIVDSVIVKPDSSCIVFFAKQITTTNYFTYGAVQQKSFHIYKEVVYP